MLSLKGLVLPQSTVGDSGQEGSLCGAGLGRAKQGWRPILQPTISSWPPEEGGLVTVEAQGFFSNIPCFSAPLLVSVASQGVQEDWSTYRFAD